MVAPVKNSFLFLFVLGFLSFSTALFAETSPQIDTILTDYASDNRPMPKEVFTKDTPFLYVFWKSTQLKQGQKIKSVWIAEDTNNVAPPNYKIDETELMLQLGRSGDLIALLPGNQWSGKFKITKPNKGWPLGKYHMDIYVDNNLVKSIKYNVIEPTQANTENKKSLDGWGVISVDSAGHNKDSVYGIGGGFSREEAEKNAQNFCNEAGGEQCSVVVAYQQCGAFALSKNHNGAGTGASKKIAEDMAISQCNDSDCLIIASDCN
ncbi:MAG: DUF4189 domain-containing protein [Legionella sp.]|uniref:DUF4189 domain-containing protein n=1 Tax=Legionella sp. TaxID=459 RepID=UPI00284BD6B7|nr:DUF4189 domain-containing protein [Legionella sp.]